MLCVRHSPECSTSGDSLFLAINWKGCQKKKNLEGARVGGLREEEAADGEGDGGEHGGGHGEQEESVTEDLDSWQAGGILLARALS